MREVFKVILISLIIFQNILSSTMASSKSKKALRNLSFFRIDLKNLSFRLDRIGENLGPVERLKFSLHSLYNSFNARNFEDNKFIRISGRLVAKIHGIEALDLVVGQEINTFDLLKVDYLDGGEEVLKVIWKTDQIDFKSPGSYYLPGVLDQKLLLYRPLNIVEHIPEEPDSPEDLEELEESQDLEIEDFLDQLDLSEALIGKKTKEEELEEEMES